jgi:hypothetical protein
MVLWKRGMSTQYQLSAKNVAKIESWFGGIKIRQEENRDSF